MSIKSKVLPYLDREFVEIDHIANETGLTCKQVTTAIRNLQHQDSVPVIMVTKKIYGCRLIGK